MKSFGDWSKQLGFSGAVLSVGLIVTTSSSAWSVSPVPEMVASSQGKKQGEQGRQREHGENEDFPCSLCVVPDDVSGEDDVEASIISPPTPLLQGYRVYTSRYQPANAEFCPPSPPTLGGTGVQSPPELGDLGGFQRLWYTQ